MKDLYNSLSSPPLLRRVLPDGEEATLAAARLERHARSIAGLPESPPTFEPSRLKTLHDSYGPFGSAERFHAEARRRIADFTARPAQTMDLPLNLGMKLHGLPYDVEWSTGAATGFQRFDGKLLTFGQTGFSACGVGILLDAEASGSASVTPMGTWDYSLVSFDNYPDARSQGGMGMVVYESGTNGPLVHNHVVLWSRHGLHQFQGESGSGRIADLSIPTQPFGPIPFAPLTFGMGAGRRYEVWVWVWQEAALPDHSAYLSILSANIPLMAISLSPPPILH